MNNDENKNDGDEGWELKAITRLNKKKRLARRKSTTARAKQNTPEQQETTGGGLRGGRESPLDIGNTELVRDSVESSATGDGETDPPDGRGCVLAGGIGVGTD